MWLFGDFNGWNKYEFPFERLQFGKWEIKLKPDGKRGCRVPHLSKLKLAIKTPSGEVVDRSFFPPNTPTWTFSYYFNPFAKKNS